MDLAANEFLSDIAGWQRMLDRHAELFTELAPGSRIGLLAREVTGFAPGRQPVGWREARFGTDGAILLVWEAAYGRMLARNERIGRFADARADFRAERQILTAARREPKGAGPRARPRARNASAIILRKGK